MPWDGAAIGGWYFQRSRGKHAMEALPRIRKREGKVSFCFRVLLTEVPVPPGSTAFQSQGKTRRLMLLISSVSAVLREGLMRFLTIPPNALASPQVNLFFWYLLSK